MNRRMTTSIVSVAMMLAAFAAPVVMAASQEAGKTPPNLAGAWSVDRSQGDQPGARMGNGPRPEGGPGDRGGRPDGGPGDRGPRPDGPRGDRAGHGPGRMPEIFSIVQATDSVELRDSTGVVIRRIVIGAKGEVAPKDASGVEQVPGTWKGPELVVETPSPRGGTATQTYKLSDDGKSLNITTHIDANGDRPARDFTRVYQRKSA
jgi:hypothetical protein